MAQSKDKLFQPANSNILHYLQSRQAPLHTGIHADISCLPEDVSDPYYNLGTHPDLVSRLWDEITVNLSEKCNWVVYNTPVLMHPRTSIIFGFACGTHTYALRLPEETHKQLPFANSKRVHQYSDGSTLNLDQIGKDWVFGAWHKNEISSCVCAYNYASKTILGNW